MTSLVNAHLDLCQALSEQSQVKNPGSESFASASRAVAMARHQVAERLLDATPEELRIFMSEGRRVLVSVITGLSMVAAWHIKRADLLRNWVGQVSPSPNY